MRRLSPINIAIIALSCGLSVITASAFGAQIYHISQKDRSFEPNYLSLQRGESIEIINDDGDLIHHAYVESPTFNFDTNDQEPGEKARIVFPVVGTFAVLCGIHPKMKLTVHVEER